MKFKRGLQHKQMLRQKDRQNLMCRMATKLSIVPKYKGGLSNDNNKKIRAFVKKFREIKEKFVQKSERKIFNFFKKKI